MRLGIKFCPPQRHWGGSQHTQAVNLVQAIYSVHADLVLFSSFDWFSRIDGLPLVPIDNPHERDSLPAKVAAYVCEQLTFKHWLRAQNCDVLLCPFNSESPWDSGGVPQVLIVRDLIPLVFPQHFPATARMWRLVYQRAIRHARAIITVSEHTRRDLLRILNLPPDRITVVPNAYSPVARQQPTGGGNHLGKYILYVSSSHYPYKNILRLLEAYERLRADFAHRLVVVGQPVPRFSPAIEAAIESRGLTDAVKLVWNVSDQELAALYRHADLFVYPTIYEGFGMPPLEAMSCGVPVVASNRTSVPEVCGQAAHYIDPYSVEDMHLGMTQALVDPSLRSRLIARGLERAAQFDWQKTAHSIVEVCRQAALK